MLGPLASDQADAAGGGMEQQHGLRTDLERPAQEIFRRHALQHDRCGGLVVDRVGDLHGLVRRDHDLFGIAAGDAVIGDAVADLEPVRAGPDGGDDAGAFLAESEGHLRRLVDTGPEIDVDEVDARAVCRTRTSPSPGWPGSCSSHFITSGPPTSWTMIALLIAVSLMRSLERRSAIQKLDDAADGEQIEAAEPQVPSEPSPDCRNC